MAEAPSTATITDALAASTLESVSEPATDPSPEGPPEPAPDSEPARQATPEPEPVPELPPPRDDPFTLDTLWEYNGSDENKPLLVSIKGTVFDVSDNYAVYGPHRSYAVFTGRDASHGMGCSSIRFEDAYPDYSGLSEAQMGVLDQWHAMFTKKYPIVGKVVDHPTLLAEKEKGKGKARDFEAAGAKEEPLTQSTT
ncbi:Cytochrome B5 [Mycena indigotica]|uniref:Cytochrome B5 n=1 Tax=Mycena indigotica TaxID=2126181 RepID=A0A8H6S2R1_9AGAR|nr:Cytochrome B5 [Mycena indigotica]KAF7291248.1 Cytochrome B5 [Mycena indigotica]